MGLELFPLSGPGFAGGRLRGRESGDVEREGDLARRERADTGEGEELWRGALAGRPVAVAGIDFAEEDAADETLRVVAVLNEIGREGVEKLGMAGRVCGMHLVERMDQSAPHQARPET